MKLVNKYILLFIYKIFLRLFSSKKDTKRIYLSGRSNILLIQLGNLQQALTITPFLEVLNTKLNYSITMLVNNSNLNAFNNNPHINKIYLLDKEPLSLIKMLIKLRGNKFDVIIDTHEYLNKEASIVLGFLKSKYKVGFVKEDVNLLTHKVFLQNPNKIHIIDRILSLTDVFDISYSKTDLNIVFIPSKSAVKSIEDYLIKNDLTHKFKVLINISERFEMGSWGLENYKKLLKYLENYDVKVIIAASIDDIETAELLSNKKHTIYYNTDFQIFAELIKNVEFIFSHDSFFVQLASAFKIPIYCLFVQHKTAQMINVPYNSDFDFALTDKENLSDISYGKVLNSFIPYFEYVYERSNSSTK